MNITVKKIKSTLFFTILIMIILMAIYNIAFATEETNLNTNKENTESVTGVVYGTRKIRTFSHLGASGGIGSGGTSIEEITPIVKALNNHSISGMDLLSNYASIFCLRHHQHLPAYRDFLDRIYYEDIDVSKYITLDYDRNSAIINIPKELVKDKKKARSKRN